MANINGLMNGFFKLWNCKQIIFKKTLGLPSSSPLIPSVMQMCNKCSLKYLQWVVYICTCQWDMYSKTGKRKFQKPAWRVAAASE